MAVADIGIYSEGVRVANPATLDEAYAQLRGGAEMVWIGLYRPDEAELNSVAQEFGLHPLAVEDALKGHPRAKLERFGQTLFAVLRPARYLDTEEQVEFGEVHVFLGPNFVVTVLHAENPDFSDLRRRAEQNPALLRLGPGAVLYAVLDEVVDAYAPVITGLQNDIDEIEDQLFGGAPEVSQRIYELLSEVMAFQRATFPLRGILESMLSGNGEYTVELELLRALRDVLEHVKNVAERADNFRALLETALTVHSTLVSQQQNEEMRRISEAGLAQNEETRRMSEVGLAQNEEVKKISSWAAILFAPTLVGTIYGMNFEIMPELEWAHGYPLAIGAMLVCGFVLWSVFKLKKWI